MSNGEEEAERGIEAFGRGVRTALRNNATAYGFSITITVSYGLVSRKSATTSPSEAISFGFGAALGFVVFGILSVVIFRAGRVSETGQVATISGTVDVVAVVVAVLSALGLSRIAGYWSWPATGAGAAVVYLLIGGLDVLLARFLARHTSFGSSQ
jgi:hypothetical protein